MNKEIFQRVTKETTMLALGAATVGALLGGVTVSPAEASTPCPTAEEMQHSSNFTLECRRFLLAQLDHTVYREGNKVLEIAAYQKESRLPVTGTMTAVTARSVARGDHLAVTSPRPNSTEFLVDKSRQVAYDIVNGQVTHEIAVSTGSERYYADRSQFDGSTIRGYSNTTTGKWHVNRIEGPNYRAPLGNMPNAHFYSGGYAVHEDPVSVTGRGSHGCVRVDHLAMPLIINDLHYGATVEVVEHL